MRYFQTILRYAIIAVVAFCVCISITYGQVPRTFSYQGTLTDQVQTPFPDSSYKLSFAIYSVSSGGSVLWQETHDVITQGGVFDVTLGSSSPLVIAFDKQLWLGITLQGNSEMTPRTPLVSTPYSLYSDLASTATALAPNATGAVLSLNGLSGNLTLQGGGKTTVSQNGSTVLISTIGGIERIDAADGSLTIINPNGPISTLSVADGGISTGKVADAAITTSKLADNSVSIAKVSDGAIITSKLADGAVSTAKVIDGSITAAKVSSLGASSGQALTFNGTNIVWASPSPSGAAGGDLTGNYPNPSVAQGAISTSKLADGSVTTSKLADGSVSTPKISDGAITTSKVNTTGAIIGQALTFNGTNVVWGSPSPSGAAGGDLAGTYPNPNVATNAITTNKLADGSVTTAKLSDGAVTMDKIADAQVSAAKMNSFGASTGQTLVYNGTNVTWGSPSPGGNAGGDLTGTYPNPSLVATAVTPGSYGSATQVPVFNVDSKGRVTGVTNTTITASPAGVAGGDLTGTYPNPTITTNAVTTSKILDANVTTSKLADGSVTTAKVNSGGATSGQALTFNGTNVVWGSPSPSGAAGGDLTGTYPNPTITTNAVTTSKILDANVTTSKIADGSVTTAKVNSGGATSGQALTFNGTNVVWGSPSPSGAAGGDLTGTYPNPTITTNAVTTSKILDANVTTSKLADGSVTTAKVNSGGATNGQALTFNGTNVVWGSPSPSGAAGGDLTGTYPNPTITTNAVTTSKILDANVTTSKLADGSVTTAKVNSGGATSGQALTFNGTNVVWGSPSPSGAAGGDLTGTYPNPTITTNAVTTSKILDANITTSKLADGSVTTAKVNSGGATSGQALTFNGTNVVWGSPSPSGAAGGDLTGTYPNPTITSNAVTTSKILDANVTTSKLADGSVTTAKVNSGGATSGQALTFNGTNVVWGSPSPSGAAGGDLTGTYPNPTITTNAVTTSKILDANITTSKLADGSVTTAKVNSGGATSGQALTFNGTSVVWGSPSPSGAAGGDLAGTYPNPTITSNAVTTSKILDANVTTSKLADGSVTTAKVNSGGATSGQALTFNGTNVVWGSPSPSGAAGGDLTGTYPNPTITTNAVTTSKILDANVTTSKLADASVTTAKVNDGAITTAKVNSGGATNGQALTFNGTNVVWGSPSPSGAAGGDLTGTYPNPTITTNAVTTSKILDANVTTSKLADGSVTTAKVNSGGATSGQALTFNGTNVVWGSPSPSGAAGGDLTGTYPNPTITTNAVTTSKILDANVTTSKLADGSVTTAKVNDGAITTAKVNSGGATSGQALTFNGTNVVWGSPSPSGAAGGDLTGTYPNPTITTNAVTTSKILDANVTTSKLADGSVTAAKVNSGGATSGQALTFNGTNVVWGSPSPSGAAGGDLTGTYPNPTITTNAVTTSKILDANVTTSKLADASVTTAKVNDGAITTAKVNSGGATSGQALTFNGTNVVWGSPSPSGAAGGDLTGTYPNPTITTNAVTTSKILDANVTTSKLADGSVTTAKVNSGGATSGQALTFNGTNVVWGSPSPSGAAGGDLTGTYPNPTITTNAVTTTKILDANVTTSKLADGSVTTIKVNDGAITTAKVNSGGATSGQALTFNGTNVVWGSPSPSGAAGGDLTGTYPNPTITTNAVTTTKILDANVTTSKLADGSVTTIKVNDGAITTAKVSSSGATSGQALTFNGTNVVWGSPSPSGAAGGDLTGTYPNPAITTNAVTTSKILDANITTSKLADGSVTTIKVNDGAITTSKLSSSGATSGQALTFNGTDIGWGSPSPSGAAGGDLTGTYPNPTITTNAVTTTKILDANVTTSKLADGSVTTAKVNSGGATSGQALTFNGTNVVWGSPSPSGAAGGDLTGTYPNPTLTATAVTAGNYGSASQVPVFTVDSKGRITGVSNTPITASPSGAAGGDLTGTYPNPTITTNAVTTSKILDANVTTSKLADASVTTAKVNSSGATVGQALTFNGTNVVWSSPSPSGAAGGDLTGTYPNPTITTNAVTTSKILDANVTTSKLADASVTAAKVNSSGATVGQALTFNGTNVVWSSPSPSGAAGGDLTGSFPNPTIATNAVTTSKILDANVTTSKLADASVTTEKVNSAGATSGQALTFNGTNVVWGNPTPVGTAGGDLSGSYPNPNVVKLQGRDIASTLPSNGQSLVWNQALSRWEPSTPAGGDVVGPASATDNAVTRFDLTTGKLIQNSALIVDDYTTTTQNNVTLRADDGVTASINLVLAPKGTGAIMADKPDGAASGGNARGQNAVDWQTSRSASTQIAGGAYSVISGGNGGTVTGAYSTIAGGNNNTVIGDHAVVSGGNANKANYFANSIGGGYLNSTEFSYATIPGGYGMHLGPSAEGSFGFNGYSGYSDSAYVNNARTAYFGNVDLWLGNTRNQASQLRFYEAQAADGTFPAAGTNYTAFVAGTQSADITYTLPTAAPLSNGQVLSSTTGGALSWTTANLGDVVGPASATDNAVSRFDLTTGKLIQNSAIVIDDFTTTTQNNVTIRADDGSSGNIDLVLSPKGNGALVASKPGGGADARGIAAIDWQISRSASTQVAAGDYSTIGGGRQNTAASYTATVSGGILNSVTAGNYGVVSGGNGNTVSGSASNIGGGASNTNSGTNSVIAGGVSNVNAGNYSTIGGGFSNNVSFSNSTVGGGSTNIASANNSTVGGGFSNTASGSGAFVGGGSSNIASSGNATVAGGSGNQATSGTATVGGGANNIASGGTATISGGSSNTASGNSSTVDGGASNSNAGDYSTILGGRGLTLGTNADRSIGFHSNNSAGTLPMTIDVADVAVFGNSNLWLANNDNSASELRFYEAYNASGVFPSTANYTAFKAGTQAADVTYTLPIAAPGSNGQVLSATTAGVMSWTTMNGGDVVGPASATDNAISRFDATTGKLIQNSAILIDDYTTSTQNNVTLRADDGSTGNIGLVLSPKGSGALTAQKPDGANAGGNARGVYAVDLQMLRTANTQVASGQNAVITGGTRNTASSPYSVVSGGYSNTASTNDYTTVAGGFTNTASGHSAIIGGGQSNNATGPATSILGGVGNAASSNYSSVGGGQSNTASGQYSVVSGGRSNTAGGYISTISGGYNNSALANYSSIVGGNGLTFTVNAERSIGYNGNNNADNLPMTIDAPNVAIFANTNLWLARNDNITPEIRFYETYLGAGSFPSATTNYTAFKAGVQSADITYTLPGAAPSANGQVLSSTTGGALSWTSLSADVTGPASSTDNAATRFDLTTGKLLQNSALIIDDYTTTTQNNVTLRVDDGATADIDFVLLPKGNGALTTDKPDGGTSGGNARGSNAVDLQMSRSAATQVASATNSTIGGGNNNTVTGVSATVGGGTGNTASVSFGTVSGGNNNTASTGAYATVGGGNTNIASGAFAPTVAGGNTNTASGQESFVGGGFSNTASAIYTTVSGGTANTASGARSTVSGGNSNQATNTYATVSGGTGNIASGSASFIGSGTNNTASGLESSIGGGITNVASGDRSSVGGGVTNTAAGDFSAIPGGHLLTITANADYSFGFLANASGGANAMTLDQPSTALFGNANLWLANNNNTSSQLRFYEANGANGTFPPASINYTAFQAGAQTADITYTLPTSAPTSNGQALVATTAGVMSWATPSGGDVTGPASSTDNAISRFDATTGKIIQNSAILVDDYTTTTQNNITLRADDGATSNISLVLLPKGTGAIVADKPDGSATGGNARGQYAVDWQMNRSAATQVASGSYSTISGGSDNAIVAGPNSDFATIGGGGLNSIGNGSGAVDYSTIAGGNNNSILAWRSFIGGGSNNQISSSSNYTSVMGGGDNIATNSSFGVISGGQFNTVGAAYATIAGGLTNTASGSGSTIGGGDNQIANNVGTTVSGGSRNQATGYISTVGGGFRNKAETQFSAISGGYGMRLGTSADGSFGFNGFSTMADSAYVNTSNTAYFGNVDLWLGNTRNQASQLRFYTAQASDGTFPAGGTYYTAFKAGTQSADVSYTLPTAAPSSNGQALVSTTAGVMSWASVSGGLTNFTESVNTSVPNNVVPVVQLLATNGTTNVDIALTPKGTGALTAEIADGAVAGGNKRGSNAVDWQTSRTAATQVSSGSNSVVSGGSDNTASGLYAVVGGGSANTVSGNLATVSGGYSHTASTHFTTIAGGSTNTATQQYATVSGGNQNNATGTQATVGGGTLNTASGNDATVSGGNTNVASGLQATVSGGVSNTASANFSSITGGNSNTAAGFYSTVAGGAINSNSGDYSTILGGRGLTFGTAADQSVGFLANSGSTDMTVNTPNTAVFGNTNLWLANNSGTASELRFYELNPTSGTFPPAGTNYVAFKAGINMSADNTYTFPSTYPTGGTGRQLTSSTTGTMSWGAHTLQVNNYNIDCGNLTANGGTAFVNVVVTGAVVGGTVTVSPRGDMENGVIIAFARVDANDNVRIKFVNATGGDIDPNAINVDVTVVQP